MTWKCLPNLCIGARHEMTNALFLLGVQSYGLKQNEDCWNCLWTHRPMGVSFLCVCVGGGCSSFKVLDSNKIGIGGTTHGLSRIKNNGLKGLLGCVMRA